MSNISHFSIFVVTKIGDFCCNGIEFLQVFKICRSINAMKLLTMSHVSSSNSSSLYVTFIAFDFFFSVLAHSACMCLNPSHSSIEFLYSCQLQTILKITCLLLVLSDLSLLYTPIVFRILVKFLLRSARAPNSSKSEFQ